MVTRAPRPQRGFTYLGLLFAVALTGITLAAAGVLWQTESRRDREAELLFVGDQFRQAIGAYYEEAPAGTPQVLPRTIDQLIDDPRWPVRRRHLRKRFVDPITGTRDWGVIEGPGGTIAGVYSLSERAPLKRAFFPEDYTDFAEARSYRDWRFVYVPSAGPTGAGARR